MNKYEVIGTAAQFAIIDFKLNLNHARRTLKDAKFSNGCPAKCAIFGFKTKRDANLFAERCNSMLAVASGRLGRWITPTFVAVRA